MKFRFVDCELRPVPDADDAHVGLLTLNRPDRKNALGPRILLELDARLAEVKHSRANVVVLRGAGGDFCAGGDLKEETLPLDLPEESWGLEGEYGELARWMINDQTHVFGRRVLAKLETLPQPIIASIDGVAAGGGFEMAIACDLRIASDRMRMTEIAVSSGFVSEWSCPRNLPKLIGLAKATELILTGRFVEAEEALAIGLVNRVVPADDLEAVTLDWANQMARLPAVGVRYAKEMIKLYNQDNRSDARGIEEIERVLELMRRDEAAEGIAALLERRQPHWRR
jgi:enoyl-CoA hydratase/carnithine racemase